VHRNINRRPLSHAEARAIGITALNPYKQAIFTRGRVIAGPLVQHGIIGIFGFGIQRHLPGFERRIRTRLTMNTNLKVALSAIALAALVAAPAVAKSRTTQHTGQSQTYSNSTIGTDPDAFVRRELQRDHDYFRQTE
jgi:hypothetical protein